MRRSRFFVRWVTLVAAAILVVGFKPASLQVSAVSDIQRTQITAPSSEPQATPATPPTEPATAAAVEPERPLTPDEQKAVDARLHFDRVLVDAAVVLTDFENYRRGKTRTPISISAFRNFEIEMNAIADADPANEQARDMAKRMQAAQFEILQPSMAVANVASRQLYADAMSTKLQEKGVRVSVGGAGARLIRFVSPQMTRDMGAQLGDSAKIFDQARGLQFDKVIFTNGRRSWTYRVESGRYR